MGTSTAKAESSRRERELAFRTGLILEAAEQVFAERGFQAASVEEIAGRAEVAIATLYKMFGNKEELFAAIVDYRQESFLSEIEAQVAVSDDPAERLQRLIEGIYRYFERHQAAFRIYLGATHGFPWHIRSSMGERAFSKYQDFIAFVAAILEAGMRAGQWPKDDATRLAGAVVGALNALLTQWQTNPKPAPVHGEAAAAVEIMRRILGAARHAAAPTGARKKAVRR